MGDKGLFGAGQAFGVSKSPYIRSILLVGLILLVVFTVRHTVSSQLTWEVAFNMVR